MSESGRPDQEPSLVSVALVFYGAMTLAACALSWLVQGRLPLYTGAPPSSASILRWAVVGALGGLSVVVISRLLRDAFTWAKTLEDWFSEVLGEISWSQAFLLAVASGIGEELLFRGALQPIVGLVPASILFAMAHWPMKRSLIPWTVSAGLLGLLFGWAFEHSGHVTAPVIAHFVINLINLKAIGQTSR